MAIIRAKPGSVLRVGLGAWQRGHPVLLAALNKLIPAQNGLKTGCISLSDPGFAETQIDSLASLDTDWPPRGTVRQFLFICDLEKIPAGGKRLKKSRSGKPPPAEKSPGRRVR